MGKFKSPVKFTREWIPSLPTRRERRQSLPPSIGLDDRLDDISVDSIMDLHAIVCKYSNVAERRFVKGKCKREKEVERDAWFQLTTILHTSSSRRRRHSNHREAVYEVFPADVREQNLAIVKQDEERFERVAGKITACTEFRLYLFHIIIVGGVLVGCTIIGNVASRTVYTLTVMPVWYICTAIVSLSPITSAMFSEYFTPVAETEASAETVSAVGDTHVTDSDRRVCTTLPSSPLAPTAQGRIRRIAHWLRARVELLVSTRTRVVMCASFLIGVAICADAIVTLTAYPEDQDRFSVYIEMAFIIVVLVVLTFVVVRCRIISVETRRWTRVLHDDEEDYAPRDRVPSSVPPGRRHGSTRRSHRHSQTSHTTSATSKRHRHRSVHHRERPRLRMLSLPVPPRMPSDRIDLPASSPLLHVSRLRVQQRKQSVASPRSSRRASPHTSRCTSPPTTSPKQHNRVEPTASFMAVAARAMRALTKATTTTHKPSLPPPPEPSTNDASKEEESSTDVADGQWDGDGGGGGGGVNSPSPRYHRRSLELLYGNKSTSIVQTKRAVPFIAFVAWSFTIAYVISRSFGRLGVSLSVGLGVFLVAFIALFIYERRSKQHVFFDLGYLIAYVTVITHFPMIVGPFVVILMHTIEDETSTTTSQWLWSMFLPIVIALVLHVYLFLTEWVASIMSAPSIYPRFVFVAQVFRHAVWYVIFGLTPFGITFGVTIVVMNVIAVIDHGQWGVRMRQRLKRYVKKLVGFAEDESGDDFLEEVNDRSVHLSTLPFSAPPPPPLHPTPSPSPPPPPPTTTAATVPIPTTPRSTVTPTTTFKPSTRASVSTSHRPRRLGAGQLPSMILPSDPTLIPASSEEYSLAYGTHQRKILNIRYEICIIGQDIMAGYTAMCISPVIVWYMITYSSEEYTVNFRFTTDYLGLRFGIAIGLTCIRQLALRWMVNSRTAVAKKELEVWSVFNTHSTTIDEMAANVNRHSIHVSMDAQLRRNVSSAINTYLQNRNVCVQDVLVLIARFLRDINSPVADMAFEHVRALHFTVLNMRNNHVYFCAVSIVVFFSVIGAFDQFNKLAFWRGNN